MAGYNYGQTYVNLFIKNADDPPRIECHTGESGNPSQEYPILSIGNLDIFPTIGQLREIRDIISRWLDTEGRRIAPVLFEDAPDDQAPFEATPASEPVSA